MGVGRLCIVVAFLCQLTSTWAQVSPKTDVVLLLDSSDAVGPAKLASLRAFLLDLVQQWNIAPDAVQVSIVSYGGGVHEEFTLDANGDLQSVKQAIFSVPFRGGTSDQADAIKYARSTSFTPGHGSRPDANHVIIHVTDQAPKDPAAAAREAGLALDQGVKLYSIAVGDGSGTSQMNNITSDPLSRYLLKADTYSSLKSLVPVLGSRINNEVPRSEASLPAPSSCLQKADLVFLIDSSSSVGQNDFHHLEDFLKDVIVQLPVQPDKVRVGVAQYGNHPSLEFGLDIYTERLSMMRAVDGLDFMGGGTNTAEAIHYTTEKIFSPPLGARQDVPHIAVVITDGQSGDQAATAAAADRARQNGVSLLALGVGHNIDQAQLADIADDPDSGHVFQAGSYRDLKALSTQILDAACKVKPVSTAVPVGITSSATCVDKLDNCGYYSQDTCRDYRPWAEENCAKFCGFCTGSELTAPCDDQVDCSGYPLTICTDPSYLAWNTVNCPRYCGLCSDSSKTLGYYGQCFYKDVAYSHGEKWLDGCDYECVCEDGQSGSYRCYNRCPVYMGLPSECTLISVPGECCLQPVCDFQQTISTTQGSGKGVNSQGIDMCVYAGLQYYTGQSWEIGCDLRCTCTNAKLGTYVCQSYCPTFTTVPAECRLVKKPGECCETPVCEFDTITGVREGQGTVSGKGIAATPDPVCVDKLEDCTTAGRAACQDFPQWAQENCALFCNLCAPATTSTGPDDVCLHDGKAYRKGESWQAGCDLQCTCEVPALGYYRCDSKCPSYNNLPGTCSTQDVSGECCPQTVCNTGSFYPSASNLTSVGNGDSLSHKLDNGQVVSVLPTDKSNTRSGQLDPTWRNRIDGCLFQGRAYVQGQQWQVGCQLTCICTDATIGQYQCRERCPIYENVPATCKNVTDPSDTCCKFPSDCGPGTNFVAIPVYPKEVTTISAVMSPSAGQYTTQLTVAPDGITVRAPTTPASGSGNGFCIYKNVRYQHGEAWEDGCLYNCVCEDGATGSYRCIEKCETFVNLPDVCHLETDPNNPCCERPVCVFVAGHEEIRGNMSSTLAPAPPTPVSPTLKPPATPTLAPPTGGSTTLAPPTVTPPTQRPTPGKVPEMCMYEGQLYTEGQTWYDACDFKCTCVDGLANSYTCITRCPQYEGDFSSCSQLADPEDPQCCSVPSCPGEVVPPGQFTGTGTVPTRDKCLYKGEVYNINDVWEDGCRLQCECIDPSIGYYQCTDRCPKVAVVPQGCTLVPDVANRCCQTVQCSPAFNPTPLPGPGGTTLQPPKAETCLYQEATYFEGQTWYDGCQRQCRCEQNGIYTCTERCPAYEALPEECVLVTDELDTCCKTALCTPQTGRVPILPPKVITGVAQSPDPGLIPRLGACVYKGVLRGQGEQWLDGCEYSCTCEDAQTGQFKCIERCPSYGAVPPQCQLVKDAAEPCCDVVVCDPNYVTPAPGVTTTMSPPRTSVCVYEGQSYTQGQAWYTGCDYRCVCEDAAQGVYRCTDRCAVITGSLPAQCKLMPDPNDPLCCEVASCSPMASNTSTGYLIPTLPPGTVTGRQVTPTPAPGQTPLPDVCIYGGKYYSPGQRWTDGCEFDCLCEGQGIGKYTCSEICPDYSVLPAQCTLVPDPTNPCCKIPFCDETIPTPPTIPPQATLIPGVNRNACVYNGVMYFQDSHWNDGCDSTCVCEDSMVNKYRCDQRCPRYDSVPTGCTLQTDPQDACCQVVICDPSAVPNPAPVPYPTPYPIPARLPGKTTGQSVGNNTGFCQYNGVQYKQGETWDADCLATCVCLDQQAGIYECTERCVEYLQLPMTCQLVQDPNDPCCSVPKCGGETTSTVSPTPENPPTPAPQPGSTSPTASPAPGSPPTPAPQPGSTSPTVSPAPGSPPTQAPQPGSTSPTASPAPGSPPTPAPQPGSTSPTVSPAPGSPPTPAPQPGSTSPTVSPAPGSPPTPAPQPGSTSPTVSPAPVSPRTPAPQPGSTSPTVSPAPGSPPTPAPQPGSTSPTVSPAPGSPPTPAPQPGSTSPTVSPAPGSPPTPAPQPGSTSPTVSPAPGSPPTPAPQPGSTSPTVSPAPGSPPTPAPQPGSTSPTVSPAPGSPPTPAPQPGSTSPTVSPAPGSPPTPAPQPGSTSPTVSPAPGSPPTPAPQPGSTSPTVSPAPGSPPTPAPQPGSTSPTVSPAPGSPPTPAPQPGSTSPTVSPAPGSPPTPAPQPGSTSPTVSPAPGSPPTPAPQPGSTSPTVSPAPGSPPTPAPQPGSTSPTVSPAPGSPPTPAPQPGSTSPTVSPAPGSPPTPAPQPGSTSPTVSPAPGSPPTPAPQPGSTSPTVSPTPGSGPTLSPSPGSQTPTASPTPTVSPNPNPTPSPTQSPRADVCVYKGQWYTQGQVWYDGCAQVCRCENAMLNYTMCNQRCKQYSNVPNICTMIPDPDDPACCLIPDCDPGTGQTATGFTGKVTGFGTPPGGVTATPIYGTYTPIPLTNTCLYKGVAYATGQRWRDSCDYSCECKDGITGQYECVEICPTYPNPGGCPMVREPLNPCCLVPSCTPDLQATPLPAPTPYPLQVSTLVPQTAFCVYQGTPYKQYAEWHDDCALNCRCEDASLNQINCDQRCPDYANFPDTCTLITDPTDACCQIPLCAPTPGSTPGVTVTGVRGSFTGNSGTPTDPSKPDTCVYHGVLYNQGDSWTDACSFNCTCEGKARGLYSCNERCSRYPVVPQGCSLVPDPTDACCEVLDCSPGAFPTPGPTPNPGSGVSTLVPPLAGTCVYNGQSYRKDQVWYDGCSLQCTCDDADNNFYTCRNRCPQYGAVDRSCVMIPDPQDPTCCTVPNCPLLQPGAVPTPGPVAVTQSPGKLVGIGMAPTPTPMATPASYTGTTPAPPTPQPGCMYKGKLYRETDQWADGCDWNCECLDDSTGLYSCTSRCPSQYYNNLPQQCVLVQDPDDACCTLPYCDFIHPTPFPNGLPTLEPGKQLVTVTASRNGTQGANEFCVYGGSFFREGETWNDGCELACTCDNARRGLYTCRGRCGEYFGLPDGCTLATDPQDQCCLVPSCTPSSNATPTPGSPVVINPEPPRTFTGRGGQPTQPDGPGSSNTGYNNVCIYNGQTYQQDQQFDDGCQYKCTCIDALYGKFRCTERCARYENLPASCQLVEDPNDVCCQIPQCPTPSPASPTVTPLVTKPTDPLTTKLATTQSSSSPPPNVCVYDGKYHVQGDVWMDPADCSIVCDCEDAAVNRYTCVSRCPVYSELPSYCTLVTGWTRNTCCRLPQCTVGNEVITDAVPIGTVTVTGGSSGAGTPTTSDGKQMCRYGSQTYQPGDRWFDGCDKTCACSEQGGYYTCVSRCPDFSTLSPAANCSFVSLPGRCCPSVQCQNSKVGQYNPTPEITMVPPKTSMPTPIPGASPAPPQQVWVVPSQKTTLPGGGYPVPSQVTDFSGFRDKCVYKNQLYNEGETWQDGCDVTCRCVDGMTGYFTCVSECLQYDVNLLPNGCSLVQAGCCMVPECQGPGGVTYDPVTNPVPGMIPVVPSDPQVITGVRPAVFPGESGVVTGSTNTCMYKDQEYDEGQSWQDACDYTCQCTNANLGLYTCTALCPVYDNLPSTCRIASPSPGQCCGQLQCDPFPTSPSPTLAPSSPTSGGASTVSSGPDLYDPDCHDKLRNCKAYESSSCVGIYQSWARENCNLTCGYCTPSYTTTPPPCVDLKNCRLYGQDTCTSYRHWAETNCRKHCGFCSPDGSSPTTSAPTTTTQASSECVDRVNCPRYGASVCTDPQFTTWVVRNCPQFCGLCNACEYKNVSYRQGDVWKDGCNLDCQCLNATSGRYVCNDICPTYPNLPIGCYLVTKAGECCQQPVCEGVPAVKGCFYKNVAYSEGAQWTDGCDFDCMCLNSTTGDFKCKAICPRWNIPDQCTLGEPEPGLCCGLPKCPFPWSPPDDYVPR